MALIRRVQFIYDIYMSYTCDNSSYFILKNIKKRVCLHKLFVQLTYFHCIT